MPGRPESEMEAHGRKLANPHSKNDPDPADPDQGALQEFAQFAMRFGPPPDPLVAKLEPEHLTTILANADRADQRAHERECQRVRNQWWFGLVGLAGFIVLCWMFLHFGKTEHLDAVVAGLLGLAGGFGLGKASRSKPADD